MERTLIQFIDMSDKMLYDQVKAEKHFSMLINGAVSNELTNPLYALLGGIDSLKHYLANLRSFVKSIEQSGDTLV